MPFFNGFPYSDYDQINLDWVIKTCKDALDTANITKDYVDNYFANLDVQEEINNKIQQMADDGDLLALIDDTIHQVTESWLALNITNPSNPPLDASLSYVNAAAQAKATGDAIAAVAATVPAVDDTLNVSGDAADARVTGDLIRENRNIIDAVTEPSNNLWGNGDISVPSNPGYYQFVLTNPLPAGIYMISALVTSTDTMQTTSFISFSTSHTTSIPGSSIVATVRLPRNNQDAVTFTLADDVYSIRIGSSDTLAHSNGYSATWANIQVQTFNAVDQVARDAIVQLIDDLDDTNNDVETLKHNLIDHYYFAHYNRNLFTVQTSNTYRGINYDWDASDGWYHITGSVSSGYSDSTRIVTSNSSLMGTFTLGGFSLVVKSTNPDQLYAEISFVDSNDNTISDSATDVHTLATVAAPSGAASAVIRIKVNSGVTFDDYIGYAIITDPTAPIWSISGTLDYTSIIQARLDQYKYVKLGLGTFRVTGITLPRYGVMEGMGMNSYLFLAPSGPTYAIRMGRFNRISGFMIAGAASSPSTGATVGSRHGILIQGDYSDTQNTALQPSRGIISDMFITRCSGGAITFDDTGTPSELGFTISNCQIWNCGAGVNIAYQSEFHRIMGCKIYDCYYGIVNNGGNNTFVGCDVTRSQVGYITKMVDGSGRTMYNNGHGIVADCTFNHIDYDTTTLGKGNAIHIEDVGAGMVFNGGSVFYGKIYIKNSSAIMFNAFNFGRIRQNASTPLPLPITVETDDGNTHSEFFNGCIFLAAPAITYTNTNGSSTIIWDASYTRSGTPITNP